MADITMPQLGETVTEGTIIHWLKKVGDNVAQDEPIFEVSTDKVDSEVPSPAAGVLTEILVEEGATVDVGARLAVIGDAGAAPAPAAPAPAAPAAEAPAPPPAPAPAPEAPVAAAPAPEPAPTPAAAPPPPPPPPPPAPAPAPAPVPVAEAPAAPGNGVATNSRGALLSPVVRKLITENGLDAATIPGTGMGGRITRDDVLNHLDTIAAPAAPAAASPVLASSAVAPAPAPAAPASAPTTPLSTPPAPLGLRDEIVPFTAIRRVTAEHMVRSKATSAHTLVAMEVDFENIERVRRDHRDRFRAEEGFGLTYLPFISRAAVDVLRDYPNLNSSVGDDALIIHKDINLGYAVDLNLEGLIVPVLHHADGQSLRGIARSVADLASRARSRKLSADDITGGTFSITNPGPFGTLLTVPVIAQPQVAILSTDGVKRRPVVITAADGSEAIAIHSVGLLALSFDHRAVDGAYASAFLRDVTKVLETRDWSAELFVIAVAESVLRVRSLGRVRYRDGHALQRALFHHSSDEYLLLVEHNHVYTLGVRARPEHVLVDPEQVGAELVRADRGGDVTYHGPGQLVGYPILNVELKPDAIPNYVHRVEQLVIETLQRVGLEDVGRLDGYPGVWVEPDGDRPRKICAVGVRVSRGRTMHGFALNVDPDLSMFGHIVPCGITEHPVTSLAAEGFTATLAEVGEIVVDLAPRLLAEDRLHPYLVERATATSPEGARGTTTGRALERRLDAAGVDRASSVAFSARKPEWLRVEARMGEDYLGLRRTMRRLDLVTVCEEAGCPNIYECWADGTATFMINGERCTRACGFCLVDTSHPLPLDATEPRRVAEAAVSMHLGHAVVTAVARDDLPDGGAAAFAETIASIRAASPTTNVEVLIPDLKGDERALQVIFDARPDVLNHNLETVLRLQRAVRPSASYARSLAVLGRAKAAGLTTKSGIILGMGEEEDEVLVALGDLAAVGVDIVTIGQYLRPSANHLPVARFWTPQDFIRIADAARTMGFRHVEASPLTRSSYHAREAAEAGALAAESV